MAKKVKSSASTTNAMNFRPVSNNSEKKLIGTKPVPEPNSIPVIVFLMLVHLCRKVLFIDPNIKVGFYIIFVFFGSILGDVLPIPKTYFSRKDNLFNVYFVKLSWGWTMVFVGTFVYLSSFIYSSGDKSIIRKHLFRLILATCAWFFCTKSFVFIEESYGYCSKAIVRTGRKACVAKGFSWNSFSISGHSFILIYCTLIIMEEAKALVGWEAIRDHIRNEEHNRSRTDEEAAGTNTPLDKLNDDQFAVVRQKYEKYTPYIRLSFIGMTILAITWDVMLMATVLYFHSTPEKFVASIIAVFVWFFTYRFLYVKKTLGLRLPGEGTFRYMNPDFPLETLKLRRTSLLVPKTGNKVPTFMGLPINTQRNGSLEDS